MSNIARDFPNIFFFFHIQGGGILEIHFRQLKERKKNYFLFEKKVWCIKYIQRSQIYNQTCQWMACDCFTVSSQHWSPIAWYVFFYGRSIRGILQWPLLASVYRHLGDRNENQLHKGLCRIKNKQTHCIHISAQQTIKLGLRESFRTDARSLYLGFTSLNIFPACLLSTKQLTPTQTLVL